VLIENVNSDVTLRLQTLGAIDLAPLLCMSALLPIMDVKPLEELYRARNQSFQFQIKAERGRLTPEVLKRTLELRKGQVKRFIAQPTRKKGEDSIHTLISQISPQDVEGLGEKLTSLSFVREVKSRRHADGRLTQ
jgi:hypothetical protein